MTVAQQRELLIVLIETKKEELKAVQIEAERLAGDIESLERMLAAQDGTPMPPRIRVHKTLRVKKDTYWEVAQRVLREEKRNMHTVLIAQKMEKYGVFVDPKSLSQQLYAKSKAKPGTKGAGIFVKDREVKSTYGLVEWQQQ